MEVEVNGIKYATRTEAFIDLFIRGCEEGLSYEESGNRATELAGLLTPYHTLVNQNADKIIAACEKHWVKKLPRTIQRVNEVLENPTLPGAKNLLGAAAMIMDRVGLIKKEKLDIEVKSPDGIVLLPPKKDG